MVGCSKSTRDEQDEDTGGMALLEKWLVDVKCEGCRGLFYRSSPGVIVPDADWPRNGDVVAGYELANTPGKWLEFLILHSFPVKFLKCDFLFSPGRLDSSPEWLLSAYAQ